MARYKGPEKVAAEPTPSEEPMILLPASVLTTPSGVILVIFVFSPTYKFPEESNCNETPTIPVLKVLTIPPFIFLMALFSQSATNTVLSWHIAKSVIQENSADATGPS